jgi:hypothetical protein
LSQPHGIGCCATDSREMLRIARGPAGRTRLHRPRPGRQRHLLRRVKRVTPGSLSLWPEVGTPLGIPCDMGDRRLRGGQQPVANFVPNTQPAHPQGAPVPTCMNASLGRNLTARSCAGIKHEPHEGLARAREACVQRQIVSSRFGRASCQRSLARRAFGRRHVASVRGRRVPRLVRGVGATGHRRRRRADPRPLRWGVREPCWARPRSPI